MTPDILTPPKVVLEGDVKKVVLKGDVKGAKGQKS